MLEHLLQRFSYEKEHFSKTHISLKNVLVEVSRIFHLTVLETMSPCLNNFMAGDHPRHSKIYFEATCSFEKL